MYSFYLVYSSSFNSLPNFCVCCLFSYCLFTGRYMVMEDGNGKKPLLFYGLSSRTDVCVCVCVCVCVRACVCVYVCVSLWEKLINKGNRSLLRSPLLASTLTHIADQVITSFPTRHKTAVSTIKPHLDTNVTSDHLILTLCASIPGPYCGMLPSGCRSQEGAGQPDNPIWWAPSNLQSGVQDCERKEICGNRVKIHGTSKRRQLLFDGLVTDDSCCAVQLDYLWQIR